MKNDKCARQDLEYGKITENVKNEKHTLQDVKYGGKIEKGGKTNTLEQGLWRKSEKNVENEKKKHFLEKKIMRKIR